MSGAAGHLLHLHENRSLTFNDLIDILTRAASGNLEQVTEKFDGMNVVFTWYDEVRIARNANDMLQGGMDIEQLGQRFLGRGSITVAFEQAHRVLQQAISSLSGTDRARIFGGHHKRRWYSAEVVYPSGANTIDYDSNCVIFHGHPIFERTIDGIKTLPSSTVFEESDSQEGIDLLTSNIKRMQQAIKVRGWSVMSPHIVKLRNLLDNQQLIAAVETFDLLLASAGLKRSATIAEYVHAMAFDRGKGIGLSDAVAEKLALRITNTKGAPNVVTLTQLSPRHRQQIQYLVSQDKQLVAEFMRPIELAISNFACEVLNGMHSVLINDGTKEVVKLRQRVLAAIEGIRSSGDIAAVASLEKQLLKIQDVNRISSAIEGVVFVYKGIAYKLTGAWAPAHQIISLYQKQGNHVVRA